MFTLFLVGAAFALLAVVIILISVVGGVIAILGYFSSAICVVGFAAVGLWLLYRAASHFFGKTKRK